MPKPESDLGPIGRRETSVSQEDMQWMQRALDQAVEAAREGEVPVGAILVADGEIVAADHNRTEAETDPTAHAEMLVLRRACALTGYERLNRSTLYVTCEPCPMCMGGLILARVARIVYGCRQPKFGAVHSHYGIGLDGALNHQPEIVEGVLADYAQDLLQEFFRKRRTEEE